MFGNDATDKTLQKTVSQKLARGGTGSQCRVTATVAHGNVTLAGTLQYEAQRAPLLKLIARIAGVRRVIDQLRLLPKKVYPASPLRPAAPAIDAGEAVEDADAVNAGAQAPATDAAESAPVRQRRSPYGD